LCANESPRSEPESAKRLSRHGKARQRPGKRLGRRVFRSTSGWLGCGRRGSGRRCSVGVDVTHANSGLPGTAQTRAFTVASEESVVTKASKASGRREGGSAPATGDGENCRGSRDYRDGRPVTQPSSRRARSSVRVAKRSPRWRRLRRAHIIELIKEPTPLPQALHHPRTLQRLRERRCRRIPKNALRIGHLSRSATQLTHELVNDQG
jgi:hypothetical protein